MKIINLERKLDVMIRHWLPLVTRCPITGLPDIAYVTLQTSGSKTVEVFEWRKVVHSQRWKKMYAEEVVKTLADLLPKEITNYEITYKAVFSRHEVRYQL